MLTISDGLAWVLAGVAAASLTGCLAQDSESESDRSERVGTAASEIVAGVKASNYAEAVLVDMMQDGDLVAFCSGTLIAPKVVLTAGHCVYGMTGWKVTAPYAGAKGQTVMAKSGATFDWKTEAKRVDPNVHDIGLIFLESAIAITKYPTLAKSPLADGSSIVNLGRIDSGALSTTDLYESQSTTVRSAAFNGYPFDYLASELIEPGDSGGPDMQSGTHTVVAVNSGAGGGTEILARVDLVHDWIQAQIAAGPPMAACDAPASSTRRDRFDTEEE